MPLFRGTRYPLLFGGREYYKKVLATGPIAYWPQWEPSGGVSRCLVDSAQNGAYTGVTLGQPGIGDGRTSPFFDGANDFNNVFTPTFRDRFALTNHGAPGAVSEGAVMVWARVANAGVWTDAVNRRPLSLVVVNGVNDVYFQKRAGANQFLFVYTAGGVTHFLTIALNTILWFNAMITWSASADEVRFYLDGVQQGVTLNGLGVWAGNLAATRTIIGAQVTMPAEVFHGYLAHGAVWDRALSPAEIAQLAVV